MDTKFESEVDLRYSDLDTYGHVNNAVYATLAEESRIEYLEHVLDGADADIAGLENGTGIVVANLELNFERALGRAKRVTVGTTVTSLGNASIEFEQAVTDEAGVVATVDSTTVVIDRESGQPESIPEEWRERIEEFEQL